ncbi:MAG: hypothetical protein ACRBI6_04725 [Acidimicrobiales bacterium]
MSATVETQLADDFDPEAAFESELLNSDDTEEAPADDVLSEPEEDPDPEPDAEEAEDATVDDEPEAEEPEDDTEEEEPEAIDEDVTPRAQKRIVQLNEQKRQAQAQAEALAQQNEQMRGLIESLVAKTNQQVEIQQGAWEHQRTQHEAHQQAQQQAATDEQLRALGFKFDDPGHVLARNAYQEAQRQQEVISQMQARLQAFEQQQQIQQQQAQAQQYVSGLQESIATALQGYEATPEAQQHFLQAAYRHAVEQQVADPAAAVQAVLQPLIPMMRKKGGRPRTPRGADKTALKGIAVKGSAGGRKAGQSTSGLPKTDVNADPEDRFEALMGDVDWS